MMKQKINILSISLLLIIYLALIRFINIISSEQTKVTNILANIAANKIDIERNLYSTVENFDNSEVIKVEFWQLEPESLKQGKYVGYASLNKGALKISVKEESLRNILNSSYAPIGELSEEGTARDWKIKYPPGSIAHLKSIAQEAWRWDYLSKTEVSPLHKTSSK